MKTPENRIIVDPVTGQELSPINLGGTSWHFPKFTAIGGYVRGLLFFIPGPRTVRVDESEEGLIIHLPGNKGIMSNDFKTFPEAVRESTGELEDHTYALDAQGTVDRSWGERIRHRITGN